MHVYACGYIYDATVHVHPSRGGPIWIQIHSRADTAHVYTMSAFIEFSRRVEKKRLA